MKLGSNTFLKYLVNDTLTSPLIFWDTSFPAAIILEKSDRSSAAIKFANRLIKDKTRVVFSSHVCTELFNLIVTNKVLKGEKLSSNLKARNKIQASPGIITKYKKEIDKAVHAFQSFLGMFKQVNIVLPTEPVVARSIIDAKIKYKLKPGDAIHIGTMLVSQERNIAAFDSDFYKVDGINIWSEFRGDDE